MAVSGNVAVERYVKRYGEEYRDLIDGALKFLNSREQQGPLDVSIDKDECIEELIEVVERWCYHVR